MQPPKNKHTTEIQNNFQVILASIQQITDTEIQMRSSQVVEQQYEKLLKNVTSQSRQENTMLGKVQQGRNVEQLSQLPERKKGSGDKRSFSFPEGKDEQSFTFLKKYTK